MNIKQYQSYKEFLNDLFELKANRGQKKQLADFLNCMPGYISQVLKGDKTHFSLEHLEKISNFFNLNYEEKRYLLLLGQYEKAGSVQLKNFFLEEIENIQKNEKSITSHISKRGKELSDKEMAIYYGHWAYIAVHMIISIDGFQTRSAINKHFNFSRDFCDKIIDFLIDTELILEEKTKLKISSSRIHLNADSPFVISLHQNMRHKSILSLQESHEVDLHYSAVLTLSKKDSLKIRELILNFIQQKEKILLPSPNEEIVALNIDYFKI